MRDAIHAHNSFVIQRGRVHGGHSNSCNSKCHCHNNTSAAMITAISAHALRSRYCFSLFARPGYAGFGGDGDEYVGAEGEAPVVLMVVFFVAYGLLEIVDDVVVFAHRLEREA